MIVTNGAFVKYINKKYVIQKNKNNHNPLANETKHMSPSSDIGQIHFVNGVRLSLSVVTCQSVTINQKRALKMLVCNICLINIYVYFINRCQSN